MCFSLCLSGLGIFAISHHALRELSAYSSMTFSFLLPEDPVSKIQPRKEGTFIKIILIDFYAFLAFSVLKEVFLGF